MILKQENKDGIEYLEIESSNISNTSYDKDNQSLIIKFKRGGSYEYSPIPNHLYLKFKVAQSQGSFFIKNIKLNPNIKFVKLN